MSVSTATIFALLEKGVKALPSILAAGVSIKHTVDDLTALAKAGKDGKVTAQMMNDIEARLDANLEKFNRPI